MLEATSVVTPTRFEEGLRYVDFLAQAKVNRDKFEQFYKDPAITKEDLAFFSRAAALPNGPAKILALAEDWCGDVYRELPTVVRIAEATGAELRVFRRDDNPDIMDEYLSNNGGNRAQYRSLCSIQKTIDTSRISWSARSVHTKSWLPQSKKSAPIWVYHRALRTPRCLMRVRLGLRPGTDSQNHSAFLAPGGKKRSREIRALLSTALNIPNHA